MPRNEGFVQYIVEEVMQGVSGITVKGMFGGYGIYKEGIIFGLIVQNMLYFKVDESNRSDYEEHESVPFSYDTKKGKKVLTSYWEVPQTILEEFSSLETWIEKSVAVSLKKKNMGGF